MAKNKDFVPEMLNIVACGLLSSERSSTPSSTAAVYTPKPGDWLGTMTPKMSPMMSPKSKLKDSDLSMKGYPLVTYSPGSSSSTSTSTPPPVRSLEMSSCRECLRASNRSNLAVAEIRLRFYKSPRLRNNEDGAYYSLFIR